MKQQNKMATYEMAKKIANNISDKGLTSKIYKELIQLCGQKKKKSQTI